MAKKRQSIVSKTVAKDARKFHAGKLKSGSGHIVTNLSQALAIGYAQGRKKAAGGGGRKSRHR